MALQGATVTATGVDDRTTRKAVSKSDGTYEIPDVDPGMYSVTAQMRGCTDFTMSSLENGEAWQASKIQAYLVDPNSDGMDNHSRYTKGELIAAAMESNLQAYSISIFDPPRNKKPIELAEERNGVLFLEELTRRTGGIQIVVRDAADIDRAAADIGRAIRDHYLTWLYPAEYRPGR